MHQSRVPHHLRAEAWVALAADAMQQPELGHALPAARCEQHT